MLMLGNAPRTLLLSFCYALSCVLSSSIPLSPIPAPPFLFLFLAFSLYLSVAGAICVDWFVISFAQHIEIFKSYINFILNSQAVAHTRSHTHTLAHAEPLQAAITFMTDGHKRRMRIYYAARIKVCYKIL